MWNERCGDILVNLIAELNGAGVRYFILRNYEGLPEINPSKDIDIVVDPKSKRVARRLIEKVYKNSGTTHTYLVRYDQVYCYHTWNLKEGVAIHIDLIFGYYSSGYMLFSFDQLYAQTEQYKDFKVLNPLFNGLMILIYKQFNYSRPKLKESYKEEIIKSYNTYPEFSDIARKLLGKELSENILEGIKANDFKKVLSHHKQLTSRLKCTAMKRHPVANIYGRVRCQWNMFKRLVLCYCKNTKSFAFIAPDGAGKSTVIDTVIEKLNLCFCNDDGDRHSLYHHRPTILPNLGKLRENVTGEKQDTDFTNPHRGKPASPLSSFIRMSYYYLDYLIGWHYVSLKDLRMDKFTIFDRYIFDFIIDPRRSSINLPVFVRKLFVFFTPKPKIVFYLKVDPDIIYKRKQELTPEEIERQLAIYSNLTKGKRIFTTLDGNPDPDTVANDAITIILDKFAKKH